MSTKPFRLTWAVALALGCGQSPAAKPYAAEASSSAMSRPALTSVRVPIVVRAKYSNPRSLAIAVPVRFSAAGDPRKTTRTLDLELDTGSSGITVFASSLGDLPLERVGPPSAKTYGGGDVFEGQSALALVAIGAAATADSVVVRLVDRVHCAPERPSCNAASGSEDYLRAQGFHGILGVGMRSSADDAPFSPIAQMPGNFGRAYIVEAASGTLTLGPSEADERGFERFALSRSTPRASFPNGAPAFDDRSVPVCLSVEGSAVVGDCAPALIDSGSWSTVFSGLTLPPNLVTDGFLADGTRGTALVAGSTDWVWTAKHHGIYVPERGLLGGFNRILGMPFFEEFDVLFDIREGRIGLRRPRR